MQDDVVILIESAPAIPGLSFRHYRGEPDLVAMVGVTNRANAADGVPEMETVQNFANTMKLFVGDAQRELVIAQIAEEMVGWGRVWVRQQTEGPRYFLGGALLPEWWRHGIGGAIVDWQEGALREMAERQTSDAPRLFQAGTPAARRGKVALFHSKGYKTTRFFYDMRRADLENLPQVTLPPGVELRPAVESQFRKIWQVKEEAFQGQWGSYVATEAHYQMWLKDLHFDPTLWQVAWAGDEIAGSALNAIKPATAETGRPSGVVEELTVTRGWRKRGLGRALLAASFERFKARGLAQAEITVDRENESGALQLYESVGFQTVSELMILQKGF